MPPLQFQPHISQPTPDFWSSLTSLKLDKLKLDDSPLPIHAWVEESRSIPDFNKLTGVTGSKNVGVDGSVMLSAVAFDTPGEPPSPRGAFLRGIFKNFNTIEEFRSPEAKKAVFDEAVNNILASFDTQHPTMDSFILLTFADLKKYTFHYWFAFPALVSKPGWQLEGSLGSLPDEEVQEIRELGQGISTSDAEVAFLIKGRPGHRAVGLLSSARDFFEGVPPQERIVAFHDASSRPDNPGWALRNVLYYLQNRQDILDIRIVCLRQGSASRSGLISAQPSTVANGLRPQAVGWERDGAGKLASRFADLGPMLNPTRLAEQAVDLNLKLMRWRIMPELDLERIASTKCLLLGAGTLGCYVARSLMGWGVRTITFVDSSRVSYSNPVRQPLFQFEDCLNGGKPKAATAAARLQEVFPSIDVAGHDMSIPMPGHPIGAGSEAAVQETVNKLQTLMRDHDAIFLLMDSRESRWLPTVIGAAQGKLIINAALGFDSYLVMRHGYRDSPPATGAQLGCYFCNDIVAPADSLTDRTLDQMCTVTRPGVAPIAAACAVELLVSTIQHPLGVKAPAERPSSNGHPFGDQAGLASPLGPVPHQIRGSLNQWNHSLVEGAAYDKCTACSPAITDAYRQQGTPFLLRAFNESGFLEGVTGLDKLYAEAEAVLDSVDWEEESGDDEF